MLIGPELSGPKMTTLESYVFIPGEEKKNLVMVPRADPAPRQTVRVAVGRNSSSAVVELLL